MSGLFESLSGAQAARTEGKSAQNIANFNAAIERQKAVAERIRGEFASKRQAKRAEAARSAIEAEAGARGLIGSEVFADITAEQAAESELENLLIGFESETKARRAETQAELDILSGKLVKQRGKAAGRAANIRFGTQLGLATLLTGFGGGTGKAAGVQKLPGVTQTRFFA